MTISNPAGSSIRSTHKGSFRPEIQGLRALAVGLVLLFHLWPTRLPGGFVGVDVFFVISGFLIIGHLHKELAKTGTISLASFWARRVMRLLPLAFLVLVTSTLLTFTLLPETAWNMNIRQIMASLFYVENWILAFDSVDYLAADNEPSIVQHYWSLSIEEQFYFLLPLLFLAAYWLNSNLGKKSAPKSPRQLMLVTLIVVALTSFFYSVAFTSHDPAQAYFVTPTRLWEFTLGGFVALIPTQPKLNKILQNIIGWAGVAMILAAGYFYSGSTAFPGYAAFLPVLGAALFIRFGTYDRLFGIHWLASLKPAVRMGDWSYAIYLWHWPLIIVAPAVVGSVTWQHKLVLILLTFLLAIASQKLIEDPLRQASYFKIPARAFASMLASIALVAGGITGAQTILNPSSDTTVTIGECVGANALINDCSDSGFSGEPLVSPAEVESEKETPAYPECHIPAGVTDFDRNGCSLGASPENAEKTIAIFGSSHARMWLPMLDEIGKQNNWNIQGYTKSACSPFPLTTASPELKGRELEDAEACFDFNIKTANHLKDDPAIDIIITAAFLGNATSYLSNGSPATDREKIDAIDEMWQGWKDSGKAVVAIGEVPAFGSVKGPTCVAEHPNDTVDECSVSYEKSLGSRKAFLRMTALDGKSRVHFYDPALAICDEKRCYSMVGGLITRYDQHHLSEDFARSFGDDFSKFIRDEVLKQ